MAAALTALTVHSGKEWRATAARHAAAPFAPGPLAVTFAWDQDADMLATVRAVQEAGVIFSGLLVILATWPPAPRLPGNRSAALRALNRGGSQLQLRGVSFASLKEVLDRAHVRGVPEGRGTLRELHRYWPAAVQEGLRRSASGSTVYFAPQMRPLPRVHSRLPQGGARPHVMHLRRRSQMVLRKALGPSGGSFLLWQQPMGPRRGAPPACLSTVQGHRADSPAVHDVVEFSLWRLRRGEPLELDGPLRPRPDAERLSCLPRWLSPFWDTSEYPKKERPNSALPLGDLPRLAAALRPPPLTTPPRPAPAHAPVRIALAVALPLAPSAGLRCSVRRGAACDAAGALAELTAHLSLADTENWAVGVAAALTDSSATPRQALHRAVGRAERAGRWRVPVAATLVAGSLARALDTAAARRGAPGATAAEAALRSAAARAAARRGWAPDVWCLAHSGTRFAHPAAWAQDTLAVLGTSRAAAGWSPGPESGVVCVAAAAHSRAAAPLAPALGGAAVGGLRAAYKAAGAGVALEPLRVTTAMHFEHPEPNRDETSWGARVQGAAVRALADRLRPFA